MPLISSLKRELEIAIETAIMLAPDTPNTQLAKEIYRSEHILMDQLKESLIVDRLLWMIGRHKQAVAASNQLSLPGFEHLPKRVTFRDGRRAAFRHLDLEQLKAYREILVARQDKRLDALDRLIVMVAEEQRRKRSRVTVADVIEAEKKKQEWKP